MFGWRARVGYINPGVHVHSQECDKILPTGVCWAVVTLGVDRLIPEEFSVAMDKFLQAGQMLAKAEVDYIVCGGSPVQLSVGYDRALEMAKKMQETTGIPVILQFTALTNALNKLGAKKIVIATPYDKDNNERHKKALEKAGFQVLNAKGLALGRNAGITDQPNFASYRLAKEAFREAPQADAVWIACPVWPVLDNIALLEKDLGVPVVSDAMYCLWAALTGLGVKGPIKGYGTLLEKHL